MTFTHLEIKAFSFLTLPILVSPSNQEYLKIDHKQEEKKSYQIHFLTLESLFFPSLSLAIFPLESLDTTNHSSQPQQVYQTQRQVLAGGKRWTYSHNAAPSFG